MFLSSFVFIICVGTFGIYICVPEITNPIGLLTHPKPPNNTQHMHNLWGGCYGGSSNPKSLIILPLKSQIPKFLTPQIPNP